MKICTKCGVEKPLDDFFKDNRRPGGRMARCKACKTDAYHNYRKSRKYDAKRYWKNPTGERERHLIRKYGVTLSDYEQMFAEQHGKCAICGREQARAFDVDHCHATGQVRGLLCSNCNRMIGYAADNAERLRVAAFYLECSQAPLKTSVRLSRWQILILSRTSKCVK